MIKQIALKITKLILKKSSPDSDMFEAYRYRVEIILSSLLNFILVIAASIAVSDVVSGVIFPAVFISLRMFVGGYRAKTYLLHSALFLLIYLAAYYINSAAAAIIVGELFSRILTIIILLGIIPIIAFAPVQHKNKPLSEKQSRICRIIGIAVFVIISIVALVLHYGGTKYGSFMIITLSSVSLLILIEILKKHGGEKNV